jgi:hypothetical protein
MTVRRAPALEWTSPYHVQVKVVHRADPDVVVSKGNHDAFGKRLTLLRDWYPFEVLHFPIRGREQLRRKYVTASEAGLRGEGDRLPRHIEATATRLSAGAGDEVYGRFLVDDDALAAGLADGSLARDVRVRDFIRRPVGQAVPRREPCLADDAALAKEVDQLHVNDAATRLGARADSVERRLAVLESTRLLVPRRRR